MHLDLQRDKCAECGLVLPNERLLTSHLRDVHGKRKTCPKCDFVERKVSYIEQIKTKYRGEINSDVKGSVRVMF